MPWLTTSWKPSCRRTALALNRAFRGRGVVRAAILLPWAIPTVVSALVWRFMFDAERGIVNAALPRADQPLVFASPSSISMGYLRRGQSVSAGVALTDAGGGAGVWNVSLARMVAGRGSEAQAAIAVTEIEAL